MPRLRNPQPCSVCGRNIPHSERCKVLDKPTCCNCAFPSGGLKEYEAFQAELQTVNQENKAAWRTVRNKTRLKWFLIITGIFIAIDAALFAISYYLTGGQSVFLAGWIVYFITLKVVLSKKAPPFVPMDEKEYYQKKYIQK